MALSRDEIDTWATPLVVEQGGRRQAIVPGKNKIRSYDLENGSVVWESKGTTMNPIPSPVFGDGMVFVTSGFQGNHLKAIRLASAKGDITGTDSIVWTLDRDTPYVPSPLLYDGILYLLKSNSGILSAFDATTGTPHYQLQRLEGVPEVFASPVGANGRVYIAGRDGVMLVIRNARAYRCSRRTSWTTASTPPRHWRMMRSTCADTGTSTSPVASERSSLARCDRSRADENRSRATNDQPQKSPRTRRETTRRRSILGFSRGNNPRCRKAVLGNGRVRSPAARSRAT